MRLKPQIHHSFCSTFRDCEIVSSIREIPIQTRLFSTTQSINRAYETTRLYRYIFYINLHQTNQFKSSGIRTSSFSELKMRGPIVDEDGRLRILPGEQQVDLHLSSSSSPATPLVAYSILDPWTKLARISPPISSNLISKFISGR